jgi:hypothetical protein
MAKFVSRRISVCGAGSGFCWTGIDCLASSTFWAFTGNRFGVSVGVVVCPACTTVDELPDVVVAVREPLVPVTTPVGDALVPAAVVWVVSVPDAVVDDAAVDDAVVDPAAPVVAVADVELPVVGPATLVVADEDVAPRVVVVAGAAVVVIGAAVVVTAGAAVVTAGAAVVVITGGAVVVITGAGATVVCGAKVCTGASCVGAGSGGGGGASCVGGGASCVGGGASCVGGGSSTVRGAGAGVVVVTGKALAGTTTPLVSAVNAMATPEARTTIACRPRQIRSVPVIVATLSPRPWRCHAPSEMRGE